MQMQTPKILAALANDRAAHNIASKFESSLKAIEQGVADKQMWNSDYENFKYWVNEGCDKALDAAVWLPRVDDLSWLGLALDVLHERLLVNLTSKETNMSLSNAQRESSYCPKCGKHYREHDDLVCGFRYFDDTVNHERGWIPEPPNVLGCPIYFQ